MSYNKQTFKNEFTVLRAEHLNQMEEGIYQNSVAIENMDNGLNDTARTLLTTILRNAVYTSDQSLNIDYLQTILSNKSVKNYTVESNLAYVTIDNFDNVVVRGNAYVATLFAIDKYIIDTVTVTMGGVDITATAYDDNGNIRIAAVTGDVVITASALPERNMVEDIRLATNTAFANGVYFIQAINSLNTRAALIPIAQYLEKGKTYRFSLGGASTLGYSYGVVGFVAPEAGMTFEIPNNTKTTYPNITNQIVDSGWMNTDYTFTPTVDNCMVSVNFKNSSNGVVTEADRETLLANFTLKEVR